MKKQTVLKSPDLLMAKREREICPFKFRAPFSKKQLLTGICAQIPFPNAAQLKKTTIHGINEQEIFRHEEANCTKKS
jgi:hypothetical protein